MSIIIEEIFLHVRKLSNRLNELYKIDPPIKLRIFSEVDVNASCIVTYKKNDMYIELNISQSLSKKDKDSIDGLIIHEYCHYMKSLAQTGKERKYERYLNSQETMKD